MSKEPNNSQIMQEWKSRHRNAPTCMNDARETTGTKKKTGEKTDLEINGEVIKQFPREKGYPYLGHFINLNSTWEEQMYLLDETFITRLEAIDKAPLPITAKIEAINVMICSVLESKICNTCLPLQKLKYNEDLIVNRVRKWLGLTRESLQLHMNKRKVNLAKSDDPSFGGYEVNEAGIIKKNSKQCLSKSQWVELNELCARTRIQLLKTDDEFNIVLPGTSQPLQCSNYYKPLYEHLHQKQLSEWMELDFQGAIIRQEAFDMQCSQEIYNNNSLADKLVKFVTKARLQIAETNTFLHLCYPNSYQKRCPRCNNPSKTISHVLNGCMEFKNLYVARHNRIVKHVCICLSDSLMILSA